MLFLLSLALAYVLMGFVLLCLSETDKTITLFDSLCVAFLIVFVWPVVVYKAIKG